MSVTLVAVGEVNRAMRSPTQVWSRPTVVDPITEEQVVPSKAKLTSVTAPVIPETTIDALAPATRLSVMATGAPAYEKVLVVGGSPVGSANARTEGPPVSAYDEVTVKFNGAPQGTDDETVNWNGMLPEAEAPGARSG